MEEKKSNEGVEYRPVSRRIFVPMHLPVWKKSEGCAILRGFVVALNGAAKGKKASDAFPEGPTVSAAVALIDALDALVGETPPATSGSVRFGNPAYKTWHKKMTEASGGLVRSLLGDDKKDAAAELEGYLHVAFGNPTRIDYGTGHELAFVAFLCCLSMLEVFAEADLPALVFRVFSSYLTLVRKIQVTYSLEPAGSHGVWGLDDHQFLPYVFGSAQLIGSGDASPSDIGNEAAADRLAQDNLFF